MTKKFKVTEKKAQDVPTWAKDTDIEWEGEQITTESETKIEQDKGTGREIVLRFFDFGANPDTFKIHKPTAQELWNSHIRGMESLLWRDGLEPFPEVEPRLMFSKDKTQYRFIIACVPSKGNLLSANTQTLSQLLKNDSTKNPRKLSGKF